MTHHRQASHPIVEIDHLLTYVADLDVAAARFSRMGFTLSPISAIAPMGIANHLVLMRPRTAGTGNYIELMATRDRSLLPGTMAKLLSGAEGIKSMVLAASDAEAAHRAIVAAGHDVDPPVHVKREWVIAAGQSVFPEFDVILPVDAPLGFNACRYYNLDLYLREDWLRHANTAVSLKTVYALAENPGAEAAALAPVFGAKPTATGGSAHVSPGEVRLDILTPAEAQGRFGVSFSPVGAAAYLGYHIEVESTDALTACLERGAVPYRRHGGMTIVDSGDAFGNLVVFTAA